MVLDDSKKNDYALYRNKKMIQVFANSLDISETIADLEELDVLKFLYQKSFLDAVLSYIKDPRVLLTFYQRNQMYSLLSHFQQTKKQLGLQVDWDEKVREGIIALNQITTFLPTDKYKWKEICKRSPFFMWAMAGEVTLETLYLWPVLDLDFFLLLDKTVSEEEFEENMVDLVASEGVLSSIVTFSKEFPEIFKDSIALERMKLILDYNKSLCARKVFVSKDGTDFEPNTNSLAFRLYNSHANHIVSKARKKLKI